MSYRYEFGASESLISSHHRNIWSHATVRWTKPWCCYTTPSSLLGGQGRTTGVPFSYLSIIDQE